MIENNSEKLVGKLIRNILIQIFVMYTGVTFSQDVSFSQFYANPMYLNPAFSGSIGEPRIALQYRNQWHSFNNAFTTYSAAFDVPVEKLQGGIGAYIINDAQADGILNTLQLNVAYSVFVRITEDYHLHGALQAGYFQKSIK